MNYNLLTSSDLNAAQITSEVTEQVVTKTNRWISFWNDLLRNEEGVVYYSETASRKSITNWLLASLKSNLPFNQFVTSLLNPTAASDPAPPPDD